MVYFYVYMFRSIYELWGRRNHWLYFQLTNQLLIPPALQIRNNIPRSRAIKIKMSWRWASSAPLHSICEHTTLLRLWRSLSSSKEFEGEIQNPFLAIELAKDCSDPICSSLSEGRRQWWALCLLDHHLGTLQKCKLWRPISDYWSRKWGRPMGQCL